ncbi:hypothetical protein LX36DRAFT_55385 [Colletotrichum falcatum]|nr:hypothetical protein LX36DRAFT_55385 [Colletotrichum falcatum]
MRMNHGGAIVAGGLWKYGCATMTSRAQLSAIELVLSLHGSNKMLANTNVFQVLDEFFLKLLTHELLILVKGSQLGNEQPHNASPTLTSGPSVMTPVKLVTPHFELQRPSVSSECRVQDRQLPRQRKRETTIRAGPGGWGFLRCHTTDSQTKASID